jgi:hypothetical protein
MTEQSSRFRVRWLRRTVVLLVAAACVTPAAATVVMNGTRFIYPFLLAAWRIRGHLQHDAGDVWTRAANYHSRTPRYNAVYRADLMRRASRWTAWLDDHFPTHDAVDASLTERGEP